MFQGMIPRWTLDACGNVSVKDPLDTDFHDIGAALAKAGLG